MPKSKAGRPSLAVICPVFNEEIAIPLFFNRVAKVFARIEHSYEPRLFFIDNGCVDRSLEIIRRLHDDYPYVYAIVLSRNFGYQSALETGLKTAEADLYVMIDVDCEDPPEMILDFLRHHEHGYDIVYGERVDRPEGRVLKGVRKLFYRLIRAIADENFVLDMAEFSLITAEVRNAILNDTTSFPFLRASIGRIGFSRKNVPYRRHPRVAGETHYNLIGMTIFAIAGILSASTLLLRIPAYVFPFWALALTVTAMWAWLAPAAWQIPMLLMLGFVYIGFTAFATSLYVARIYKNGLLRPNAIVRPGLSILPTTVGGLRSTVERA